VPVIFEGETLGVLDVEREKLNALARACVTISANQGSYITCRLLCSVRVPSSLAQDLTDYESYV
jgi:hypothetical protein